VSIWQRHTDPAHIERIGVPLPHHLGHLAGTRIVHISDLHVGRYFRADVWARHIERINALRPDLVVITGDAMDWSPRYTTDYIDPIDMLDPRVASLAILGNHDFYFGANRLATLYTQNTHVEVLRGRRWSSDQLPGLVVWGIDDPMTRLVGAARYPKLATWAHDLDPRAFNVLLSHRPDAFRVARRSGFDLQLSGHTHGGQLSFTTPRGRRIHIASPLGPYDRGLFARRTRGSSRERPTHLYVSRGLGFAGVPYRRDCPTEITHITLHAPLRVAA
jgi:predicted MPP superfamily phosphohydrolase